MRRLMWVAALAVLLSVGLLHPSVPAWSADADAGGDVAQEIEHGGDAAHDPGGSPMPQLDARRFPGQIFWLVASFALLYWLLSRKALPRVRDVIERREETIAIDLERATRARAEADAALATYEAVLAEAHAKAAAEVREATVRAVAELDAREKRLAAETGQRVAAAEAQIAQARRTAMAELAQLSAEVAQAAVARLARVDVPIEEARRAVDAAMAEAA